jgi:hypothetical protein
LLPYFANNPNKRKFFENSCGSLFDLYCKKKFFFNLKNYFSFFRQIQANKREAILRLLFDLIPFILQTHIQENGNMAENSMEISNILISGDGSFTNCIQVRKKKKKKKIKNIPRKFSKNLPLLLPGLAMVR